MKFIKNMFGNKSVVVINKDTKISPEQIASIIERGGNNIGLIHDAAKKGNLDCQTFVSQVALEGLNRYENDESIDKKVIDNMRKNFILYTNLAAEQNDGTSQYNLAKHYIMKVNIEKKLLNEEDISNLIKAKRWYVKANLNGMSNTENIISAIEGMLQTREENYINKKKQKLKIAADIVYTSINGKSGVPRYIDKSGALEMTNEALELMQIDDKYNIRGDLLGSYVLVTAAGFAVMDDDGGRCAKLCFAANSSLNDVLEKDHQQEMSDLEKRLLSETLSTLEDIAKDCRHLELDRTAQLAISLVLSK